MCLARLEVVDGLVCLEARLELAAALNRLEECLFRDDEVALENASNLVVVNLVDDGYVFLVLSSLVDCAARDDITSRPRLQDDPRVAPSVIGLDVELVGPRVDDGKWLGLAFRESSVELLFPHVDRLFFSPALVVLESPVACDGSSLVRLCLLRCVDALLSFAPLLGVLVHVEGHVVDLVAALAVSGSLVGVE